MRQIIIKTITALISIFDIFFPKSSRFIVYNSYPDLTDNSFALFLYILESYPDKNNIWLVKKLDMQRYRSMIRRYTKSVNYKIVKRDSFPGIMYYLLSKYVFFTHGLYAGSRSGRNHCLVNLWHGMPLKNIGLLDNKKKVSYSADFLVATSELYREIMAEAMGVHEDRVLVSGQPRNEMLYSSIDVRSILNIFAGRKLIFWAPTYRKSIEGEIRTDGAASGGLPVVSFYGLNKLDSFLDDIGASLVVKLHPMDTLNTAEFEKYRNIRIFNRESWEALNLQLYSLLAEVDILLTDFSSIYIDYLLLNRPIGFISEDFASYKNSRGFVFENPVDYMPGEKINSFEELESFLHRTIMLKEDPFVSERERVNDLVNIPGPGFSEMLLNKIGLK